MWVEDGEATDAPEAERSSMVRRRGIWIAAAVLSAIGATEPVRAEFGGLPGYVGSDRCAECHPKDFAQWRLTPHARMLVDAVRDPFAILAELGENTPFTEEDVVYTVGSHWVQKYLTRIDGVLYVLPKYWNIPERRWEPYSIWNWREQPYNVHCDGCHTVGFDPETQSFFEPGVGCEACHGPGEKHVEAGGRLSEIVNPKKLEPDRAQMICMACHTDGMDSASDTYPFPVGYKPGDDLTEHFSDFFMPKPKSKAWYWGSMDFMERKRMWFFFQTKFYSTARACEVCGFDRGASKHQERYMTPSEYCGTCHKYRYDNFLEHSGHRAAKTGCTDCHVPEMAQPGKSYSIHDHKFNFSQPLPACTECHEPAHADESNLDKPCVKCHVEGVEPGTLCSYEPSDFHLPEVKYPRELTLEEACVYCHTQELKEPRDVSWARRVIPEMVDRFLVE